VRDSAVPYISVLLLAAMTGAWVNYLGPLTGLDQITFKGQALIIIIQLAAFPLAVVLWLAYRGKRTSGRWLVTFFIGLIVVWAIHLALLFVHQDPISHLVWLFVPISLMLFFKTPSAKEGWTLVQLFAWVAAAILVLTKTLELLNVIPVYPLPAGIIEFEKANYWIPISEFFGVEGRWPGPFGYNSKTGFIGALLVLIGVAKFTPIKIILIVIGALTLLLTVSRGSGLALVAGLAVIATFTRSGLLGRIPVVMRATLAATAALFAGLMLFFSPLSTTGRLGEGGIWEYFLDLWRQDPWIGVGQSGIYAMNPSAGIYMEAHNVFVQELTRFGIVGVVTQYAVIGLGVALALLAAFRGLSWPLAIIFAYYVASLTEVFQDGWLSIGTYSLVVLLAIISSSSALSSSLSRPPSEITETSSRSTPEHYQKPPRQP
jgi:hypothetical protein